MFPLSNLLVLGGIVVAIVGVAVQSTWIWATGLVTTVWSLLLTATQDEPIRGLLGFLGIPVILATAMVMA